MSRPKWLKSSFVKNKLYELFLMDYYIKAKNIKKADSNAILIVLGGGLGDTLVHYPAVKYIIAHYTCGKVLVATEDKWISHYEVLNLKTVFYTYTNNLFKRLSINRKFFKEVNRFKPQRVIYFHAYKQLHKFIGCESAIAGGYISKNEIDKKTRYFKQDKLVLDLMYEYLFELFNRKNIVIDFSIHWPYRNKEYSNIICFGVGAAGAHKMMEVEKSVEIIKYLSKHFPDKIIILMGSGERQERYANRILEMIDNDSVKSTINAFSIVESFTVINSCYIYFGPDSALYNAAALFGRPTVVFFPYEKQPFEHALPNVAHVKGDGNITHEKFEFGTKLLNSITIEDIENKLIELKL
ncbi:MAG: hypothetical protein NTX05_08025 [Fusobacteria bacterium]|nr:hypothetical protein [Fusobacteriota bacterium]